MPFIFLQWPVTLFCHFHSNHFLYFQLCYERVPFLIMNTLSLLITEGFYSTLINVPSINTHEHAIANHCRHVLAHAWHSIYEMDKELELLCIMLSAYDMLISSICTVITAVACMTNSPSHQSLQGLGSNGCWLFLILRLVSLQSSEGWFPHVHTPGSGHEPVKATHLGD